MSELDEAWAVGLAEAEERARAQGHSEIADYLALRSSNDLIRRIAGNWLLALFTAIAGDANRAGAAIQISNDEAHRFKIGNATMVGSMLSLSSGVRKILIEVGWPRTPGDGFIRGGGLACGNIKHVGIKSVSEELRLVLETSGAPSWIIVSERSSSIESRDFPRLHEANVRKHIAILLDDSQPPRTL